MAPTILQNVYRDDSHTYLLVDNGAGYSWTAAEAYAVTLGGHLVTIDNAAENNFVYDTFAEVGNALVGPPDFRAIFFLLGYNDAAIEGAFVWSSGSGATYESWHTAPSGSDLATQDYAAYFFYSNYAPGFDPTRKWFRIPEVDPNNYTIALIEIPHLLATAGNDAIDGGIGDDRLAGLGGDDILKGLDGNDELNGGNDSDRLDGGNGADTMRGGDGDDTYYVDDETGPDVDTVIEEKGKGTDTVLSSATGLFVLPDNVENITMSVFSSRVDGNGLANVMKGSNDRDVFDGKGGNDTVYGNKGDDTLRAGKGNDKVFGGDGDDTVIAGGGKDRLEGGAGIDRSTCWTGKDTVVYGSVSDIGKGKSPANREGIAYFDKGADLIDLSAIDANGGGSGNGKFKFIGSKAFTKHAGELRATPHDFAGSLTDYILVEGDVNGDGKADLRFQLDNFGATDFAGSIPYKLEASDFVL